LCRKLLHFCQEILTQSISATFPRGSAATQVNELPDSHRSPAFARASGLPLKVRRGRGLRRGRDTDDENDPPTRKAAAWRAGFRPALAGTTPNSKVFASTGSIREQADIVPVEGKAMPRPECPRITRTDAKSSIRRKPFALIRLICGQIRSMGYRPESRPKPCARRHPKAVRKLRCNLPCRRWRSTPPKQSR
jgi:hypothetical protein